MANKRKISEEQMNLMKSMYEKGSMDSEISKVIGVTRSAISYWRKRLNLKSKFTYDKISKINNEKFEELFKKGLSDLDIAKELNMSSDGIYSHRMRFGYLRENNLRLNKPKELSLFQKQVLIGTMIGDSSFKISKGSINPAIQCAHCIKQKEYCFLKTNIFDSLGASCKYHKRNISDKRNGIYYEDYTMYVPANPILKNWYEAFYNKKKEIPMDLVLNYFNEISLAFLYMDDGRKDNKTYSIATNSYSEENILDFRKFLFDKFNIETSMTKSHVIYIRTKSKDIFTNLISPYVCNCMKYKLQSLNPVNLGKP